METVDSAEQFKTKFFPDCTLTVEGGCTVMLGGVAHQNTLSMSACVIYNIGVSFSMASGMVRFMAVPSLRSSSSATDS